MWNEVIAAYIIFIAPSLVWGPDDKHENMPEFSIFETQFETDNALKQVRCQRQINEFRTLQIFSRRMKFRYDLDN